MGENVVRGCRLYLNLMVLFILGLSVCVVGTRAQSFPVYVSAGPTIYALSGGNSTIVATLAGANFESLTVGPDNADLDAWGNAQHPFVLYACDTANKAIYRLDPTAATVALQRIYSGAITPNCGRFSAIGDLFVTDKSGPGIYRISCGSSCANVALGTATINGTAVAVNTTGPTSGRGITQKYSGDLLAVDNAANRVLKFPYGNLSTKVTFATSELSAPIGVARISNGDVFVSNSNLGSGKSAVAPVIHYGRTGTLATTCPELSLPKNSKETPAYMATTSLATAANTQVNDTVFLVANATSGSTLYSWTNTTGAACGLTAVASVKAVLTGIAVAPAGAGPGAPPAVTLSLPVQSSGANPKAVPFNFNSNQFQLIAAGCTAQVTAYPLSPATVQAMIDRANAGPFPFSKPAAPSVNLGEGGYDIVYIGHWLFNPNPPPSCTTVGSDFVVYLASVVDASQFNNPRMVQCDNTVPNSEPTLSSATVCASDQMIAIYPLGGPIPDDAISGGTTRTTNSVFAVVNESTQGVPGTFCGFQTPLKNPGEPGYPASFTPAQKNTIAVKFKLAQAGGSCQNGPFVTNAEALISVARILDSSGVGVFDAINPNATASSIDTPPLFNAGNQQYSFTLTIKDYVPGTYSMTVTFLSDDTTNQTILFKIQ
jgi:hypothetical protein